MANLIQGSATKQKILDCAAALFAEKGYTETTIRELTTAVGLKNSASLYNHFQSKNAILEHMLEDYTQFNIDVFGEKNILLTLRDDPTADGILSCLTTTFPPDRMEYYLKVLCVLLQEQLRNPVVRKYMSEQIILRSELHLKIIFEALKTLGVIRQDADPDYWAKITSCLFYSFATRSMLGIGDSAPDFTGMGMQEMLHNTFNLMLEACAG